MKLPDDDSFWPLCAGLLIAALIFAELMHQFFLIARAQSTLGL